MEKAVAGREAVSSLDRRRRFRCYRPMGPEEARGPGDQDGGPERKFDAIFWRWLYGVGLKLSMPERRC